MYINCVIKSRYYIEKGNKRAGRWDIYIINLVTRLINIYYTLLQFWQNLAEFSASGRVW